MIPEIGHFSLILTLCLLMIQAGMPLAGTYYQNAHWMRLARPLATGQMFFMLIAVICLIASFANDDFSVRYVARHSNTLLPMFYKISALWGGHEGSLLLWALQLSGWTFMVSRFRGPISPMMHTRTLSIMAMIGAGFTVFILITSNPFTRILPIPPSNGQDLNPLLQDMSLIFHPPLLYMGYVGFSVVFSAAIAALLTKNFDAAWMRWARLWTVVAWSFLTLGIALGAFWAYYELGWGGWWFWDPVENASLMPWLTGTALVHALAVAEKRQIFKNWALLLAIFAFSFSLLGTFLVRSGVLTSVHAFASDPQRGLFILLFLVLVLGSALLLYALRAPVIKTRAYIAPFSTEMFLFLNNLVLMLCCAIVFLGTLFPMVIDALGLGKLSVGPPYFNSLLFPLVIALAYLLGLGIHSRFNQRQLPWRALCGSLLLAVVLSIGISVLYGDVSTASVCALSAAIWVILSSVQRLWTAPSRPDIIAYLTQKPPSFWGMHCAHIGFALVLMAGILSSFYAQQKTVRLGVGDSVSLAGYQLRFEGVTRHKKHNYIARYGTLTVTKAGQPIATLHPEKRFFMVQQSTTTETAIYHSFRGDLYVALGESLPGGDWAIRIHSKPFINALWFGALMMALGGFIVITDRRYRKQPNAEASSTAPITGENACAD